MASMFEAEQTAGGSGYVQRTDNLAATAHGHGTDGTSDVSPLALARLIEGEIIPRLLLAHRNDPMATPISPCGDTAVSQLESDEFTPRVLAQEVFVLLAHIDALLERGVTLDTIYLDLLAPAARQLGDMWENDRCDFVDVTMGLWRLQQVVHELGSRAQRAAAHVRADRRAFFTVAPGDQHSFGVVMIEDFFRRAGWRTSSAAALSKEGLIDIVANQWFELVGLTVSREDHISQLPAIIAALRKTSKNPAVAIMVGGRIFADSPGLAAKVGADGTAPDGRQAVLSAEKLLEQRANRPDAVDPDGSTAGRV